MAIIISIISSIILVFFIFFTIFSFHRKNKNVYTADRALKETERNIKKYKTNLKLDIYKDIHSQATSGKRVLAVDDISERNLNYMSKEEFNDFIMKELKENGYTVEKIEYQYDVETMKCYYMISW